LAGWAFELIVLGMGSGGFATRSSILTAREVSDGSLDGGVMIVGSALVDPEVVESIEAGTFFGIGWGRGLKTRLERGLLTSTVITSFSFPLSVRGSGVGSRS
ncbi:hypothetical protein F4604DRAFT_1697720, partial [Suillus subluteus]